MILQSPKKLLINFVVKSYIEIKTTASRLLLSLHTMHLLIFLHGKLIRSSVIYLFFTGIAEKKFSQLLL